MMFYKSDSGNVLDFLKALRHAANAKMIKSLKCNEGYKELLEDHVNNGAYVVIKNKTYHNYTYAVGTPNIENVPFMLELFVKEVIKDSEESIISIRRDLELEKTENGYIVSIRYAKIPVGDL